MISIKYVKLAINVIPILVFFTELHSQEKVTAKYLYHKADSIAANFLDDPQFIIIRSDSVDVSGKAEYWEFAYQSLLIYLNTDSVYCDTAFGVWTGSSLISRGWFDSDSALAIAEANGGVQFRTQNTEYRIKAALGRDSGLPWTDWLIQYQSIRAPDKKFVISINALTGLIINKYTTGISERDENYIYSLTQNYPNPFNATTTIEYSISSPSCVTLTLFNINGRRVETLVKSYHPSGNFQIKWNADKLSSGTYFYKLETNDYISTKKLQIIR